MEQIICSCGLDIFIPFGDKYGITYIECLACNKQIILFETNLLVEKLLSIYGEDYCRAYQINRDGDILLAFIEYHSEHIV